MATMIAIFITMGVLGGIVSACTKLEKLDNFMKKSKELDEAIEELERKLGRYEGDLDY